MMRIVIPTHGRVEKQITLRSLPDRLAKETTLVASSASEAEELRVRYRGVGMKTTWAPVKTIADKRQWILENIKDDVFMLDDDMAFYRRCPNQARAFIDGRWKPKDPKRHKSLSLDYVTNRGVESLFDTLDEELDTYGAVGISSRFGNDLEPLEWKPGANRLMHGFGYSRKALMKLKFQFNAVQFREDFHMALSLLRAGHQTLQCYEWCVAPGAYGAPGGCSSERTVEASDAAAEQLAALHPGFVKVVEKDYKGTPRKEVVVSWLKAMRSATPV
jgi:hypothetical protein